MKGCVIMCLKKMDFRKAFAVLFVLIFTVAAALPAMSASAATNKYGIGSGYYSRQAYYSTPYIFDMAWSFSTPTEKLYSSTKIALSDKVSMTVWYSKNLKTDMSDKNVVSALSGVLSNIKTEQSKTAKILVLEIKNTGKASPESLVEQYYKNNNISYYAAVLPFADDETQQTYMKKSYSDNNAALFAASIGALDNAEITEKYLSKAYDDDNIAFFAVCFGILEDILNGKDFNALVKEYAEKSYTDNRTSIFAVLAIEMDNDTLKDWYAKADSDKKTTFKWICDECDWDEFDGAWNIFGDWDSVWHDLNDCDYCRGEIHH